MDLVSKLFTRRPLWSGNDLADFTKLTTQAFDVGAMPGEFTVSDADDIVPFADLERFFRDDLPAWEGTLSIASGSDELCLNLDIRRFRRKSASASDLAKNADFLMNEIELRIDGGDRRRSATNEGVFDWLCEVGERLDCDFGLVHDDDGFLGEMYSPFGLASGLPGVYRMTLFGGVFTSIFAAESLQAVASITESRWLKNDAFVLSVGGEISRGDSEELRQRMIEIRQAIGEDYFAATAPVFESSDQQVQGLFSFLKELWMERRAETHPDRLAKIRPDLDWSPLYFAESA